MATLTRFQAIPQPPSAMPSSVAISTVPTRAPASLGVKYSRTISA
jgi:hypothetical protein